MFDFRWKEIYYDLEINNFRRYFFSVLLLILQIVFIILFGVHSEYNLRQRDSSGHVIAETFDEPPERADVDSFYPMFQDVHPSFYAGTAYGDGRLRAVTNTYISICSSVLCTFIMSAFLGKGKKEIIHIQNATLAGGIAVGCVVNKNIGLFGAMIIGSLAGIISTVGYKHLLERLRLHIHDTCGVHNLHGMPGVLSGLEGLSAQCYGGGVNRPVHLQVAYQAAALFLTLGMAIVGGLFTGALLLLPIFHTPDQDTHFDGSLNWIVPYDFVAETSAITQLAKKHVHINVPVLNDRPSTVGEISGEFSFSGANQYGPNTIHYTQTNEMSSPSHRQSSFIRSDSQASPHLERSRVGTV
ncbi:unnamed protein product [Didymodactylos carnosus]|uniref:Ammonium transporter AmtB-like domain-containing protein n=1 Tax=Didymodactylos carnosus TaxID=1234261 RepID=A0A813Y6M1_9BILA|nr:unnamed protein product [Didymodactylos carnosus]CAF1242426.1 unnamed protein product [Didymodactylos carnosus]CAF3665839.1 unnamed protein product [Didymodactylos carnosus]CAF4049949.1 unnamed protein product [Didymodactylos carnosus]